MNKHTTPTRDDLALYVMGEHDDPAALEAAIAGDELLGAQLAEDAELELLLRDAASAATFCPACDDLIRDPDALARCGACGVAVHPGGYVVEKVLVANAHGRMYVARDADGTRVALKELAFVQSPGADAIAAFEREVKFLRALEHPAIPRFRAAFEEGTGVHTRYYLAQELVEGEPLDARLETHFYDEAEVIALARNVLDILVYLQGLSPVVIHRDVKPANLLRRPDGTIALVDFGAAHVQGTTAGSTSIGTFGYMPLEQLAGEVDATTDVYALGASLIHLLTRQEPWRVVQRASFAPLNVSAPLRAFLIKMVAPEPKDRFASAAAARTALDQLGLAPVASTRRSRWSWPQLAGVAAAAATVLSLGGYGVHRMLAADPEDNERSEVGPRERATLRVYVPDGAEGTIEVDDALLTSFRGSAELPIPSGKHKISIKHPGKTCTAMLTLEPGGAGSIECGAPPITHPRISPKSGTQAEVTLDLAFRSAPITDLIGIMSTACGVGMVIPDVIDGKVSTLAFEKVPCDQALESVLQSMGLWYRFDPIHRVMRVGPRNALDAEDEAERARQVTRRELGLPIDADADLAKLPSGRSITILQTGPKLLRLDAVLEQLAAAGGVGLVLPDTIDNSGVHLRLADVAWQHALRAVLEAHGLWFTYAENGKVLRIAPRNELDAENEAELARRAR